MPTAVLDEVDRGVPGGADGSGGDRPAVVVAGVSGGPQDLVVAATAADHAVGRGGRLVLVHARARPFDALAALCGLGCEATWGMVTIEPQPADRDLDGEGRRAVAGALAAASSCGWVGLDVRPLPPRPTRRGRRRALAEVLSSAATGHGADLVVVGAGIDGRSGRELAHLVRRSTGVDVVVVEELFVARPQASQGDAVGA